MDKPHLITLRELLQSWNIQAKHIEPIRDVYKVRSVQGIVALKGNLLSQEQMRFIHCFLRHLHEQGFDEVITAIPTPDGRDFIVMEGVVYSLYDWIDGRRPDFRRMDELRAACQALSKMHRACHGFQPPSGTRPRKRWGRLVESHKKRRQELAAFGETAKSKRFLSRFDREYLKHLPDYLSLADRSLDTMDSEAYHELVHEGKQMGCVCHGDVAERNFIRKPDGTTWIIDLDSSRLDLPVMDLVKFIRRILKKSHWNPEVARTVIQTYQEFSPLRPGEIRLFESVIMFPQKFWRISDRYYHKQKFFSEEKAYDKLRNLIRQKNDFINFLGEYREHASDWWGMPL